VKELLMISFAFKLIKPIYHDLKMIENAKNNEKFIKLKNTPKMKS
jgi:hypothetical protein